MTTYSTTPTPLEYGLENSKALIASTLDAGHTQFTGTIDFVGASAASFDFTPDKFTGAMDELDAREWEIFLEEDPMPDQPGVYETQGGTIYILTGDGKWYHFNRRSGATAPMGPSSMPFKVTLIHRFNLD